MTTQSGTVGRYAGWLLAALSAGAGLIHFAEAGDHYALSWWHGTFFAVVAWFQLSWAAVMVFRPTQPVLVAGALVNLAVIATWAVSRTVGAPIGPEAGQPEAVGFADALATGFEAAVVLLSATLAVRPAVSAHALSPRVARPGVGLGAAGVLVVSTLALSPSMASHSHAGGGHGEHGMEHGAGGHGHGAGSHGGHEAVTIAADGTSACERWGPSPMNDPEHTHRGPVPPAPMGRAAHEELRRQVEAANAAVLEYPTVADAKAAGFAQVSGYVPCIGAHFLKGERLDDGFDPAAPEVILYGGIEDDAPVVGLSYLARGAEPPDGFVGDSDPWHAHGSLCLNGKGQVLGPGNATDEECAERGGTNSDTAELWMMHMWNAPGWDSRWGLFSSEHPDLGGDLEDLQSD